MNEARMLLAWLPPASGQAAAGETTDSISVPFLSLGRTAAHPPLWQDSAGRYSIVRLVCRCKCSLCVSLGRTLLGG